MTYLLRRLWCSVMGWQACLAPRCGRATVGHAAWCRRHTDAILARMFPDARDRLRGLPFEQLLAEVDAGLKRKGAA